MVDWRDATWGSESLRQGKSDRGHGQLLGNGKGNTEKRGVRGKKPVGPDGRKKEDEGKDVTFEGENYGININKKGKRRGNRGSWPQSMKAQREKGGRRLWVQFYESTGHSHNLAKEGHIKGFVQEGVGIRKMTVGRKRSSQKGRLAICQKRTKQRMRKAGRGRPMMADLSDAKKR